MAYRLGIAALVFGAFAAAFSSVAAPPRAEGESKKTAVCVTVDPRVELLSLIFRLAGNREYNCCAVQSYAKDADDHFADLEDHPVVELARRLHRERGVSYDACMCMAVHLTDAAKLEPRIAFSPRPESLDARWKSDDAAEFLKLARQFVADGKFQEFIDAHQNLYQTAAGRMQALLDKNAHLEWYEEFFGARPRADFKLVLGLFNGGNCYGAHCRLADGSEELYCILGVWKTDKQGTPDFDPAVVDTVVHEFCHSYANPIIERHAAELEKAGKKIHPRVAEALRRQNYGDWKTMMLESLTRACTLRYIRRFGDDAAYQAALAAEKERSFFWIEELSNLLGEYESHRDRYPKLDDFAPRIVEFFNMYAEKRGVANSLP